MLLGLAGTAAASDPGYPFEPLADYPTGNRDLRAADLNGDGTTDVVTFGDGEAQVRLGEGSGALGPALAIGGLDAATLQLSDLDGDGALDIATADPVRTLLGDGAGGFSPADGASAGGAQLGLGDFTGEGIPDLLVLGKESLTLLAGDGAGGLGTPVDVDVDVDSQPGDLQRMQALAVGDIDEDSNLDAVIVAYSDSIRESAPLIELLGDGSGGFTQVEGPGGILDGAQSLTLADIDEDGHEDLVSTDRNLAQGGSSDIVYGDGSGGFTPTAAGEAPGLFGAGRPAVADFDSDGQVDIAAVTTHGYGPDPAGSGGITLALADSPRGFDAPVREGADRALSGLEAADFGGGPFLDLALIRLQDGVPRLEVHVGAGPPEPRPLPNPDDGPTLDFALDPEAASFRSFLRNGVGVRPGCPPVDCSARVVLRPLGKARERLGVPALATLGLELGEKHPARVRVRPGPAIRRKLKRSGLAGMRVRVTVDASFIAPHEGETATAARNLRIGS